MLRKKEHMKLYGNSTERDKVVLRGREEGVDLIKTH